MEIITSLENKKIKNLAKLLIKKYRDEENMFLVEGQHLVDEALKNDCLLEVIATEDFKGHYDVTTTFVTYDVIKKLTNSVTPQKVVGVVKKIKKEQIGHKVLLLDGVQDPGNLGTIIRSSVAFNVDTIVLSKDTVDLYNDKVIRSSEGMIFNINIVRKDLDSFIDTLKNEGYYILGTRMTNGISLEKVQKKEKMAIIMGNEGNGVRKEILDKCDDCLYIPMNKDCESLNVGVATSIILYELF